MSTNPKLLTGRELRAILREAEMRAAREDYKRHRDTLAALKRWGLAILGGIAMLGVGTIAAIAFDQCFGAML